MTIFDAHNLPFAVALGLMALLLVIQLVGLADFTPDVDLDVDAVDGDAAIQAGFLGGFLSLLGMGRVPLVIWMSAFLFLFAALGLSIQELAASLTGGPLDAWLAAVLAGGAALPLTAGVARPLGRFMPQDETSAVSTDSLVGRRATITEGVARGKSPARAKVRDAHGHAHYVMVEPHEGSAELHSGDEILLVRREGRTFYATALAERRLSPQA